VAIRNVRVQRLRTRRNGAGCRPLNLESLV